jgi:hypothetical protein
MFGKRWFESVNSSPSRAPSRIKERAPRGFRRTQGQEVELENTQRRNKEKRQSIFSESHTKCGALSREIEWERKGLRSLKYSTSLELDTRKSPDELAQQQEVLSSLTKRQLRLFEKKGLVAGMYSLSPTQRNQFEESGIARELRAQAEEKMIQYFWHKSHRNARFRDLPKSMRRDMLLGNLYVDDFLPDRIRAEINKDITTIKILQRSLASHQPSWKSRGRIAEMAKDLRNRYDIRPENYRDYLYEWWQDNGLLAGVFNPLLESLPPQQLQQLGVDSVQNFRQRNTPVLSTDSYSGSRGDGGWSGGSAGFSTPSVSSAPVWPIQSLDDFPELIGSLTIDKRDWSEAEVNELRRKWGIRINMDCNQSDSRRVIPPLIVIPDDASPEMRAAAQAYVDAMAQIHNEKFGRNFTGKVMTRGANGRWKVNTIHTEGWSIEDTQIVSYLTSPEGIQKYQDILENTLGKIPWAVFGLPHGGVQGKDKWAGHNGQNEVSLARTHLEWFAQNLKKEGTASPESVVQPIAESPSPTENTPASTIVASSNNETSSSTPTTEQATAYYWPQS